MKNLIDIVAYTGGCRHVEHKAHTGGRVGSGYTHAGVVKGMLGEYVAATVANLQGTVEQAGLSLLGVVRLGHRVGEVCDTADWASVDWCILGRLPALEVTDAAD